MNKEIAVLGGGCFWCTEAVYKRVNGVTSVVPGYAGGHVENPTYHQVCREDTGHAEVVRIAFDPDVISYAEILEIFWQVHDPTTKNRQGNDVGPQYRSIILYLNEAQRQIAEKSLKEADSSGQFKSPIVTAVEHLEKFYQAEEYHRDYFANNPNQPYCRAIISPKVQHFMRIFPEKLKEIR